MLSSLYRTCACLQSAHRRSVERSSLSHFSLLSLCYVFFCSTLVPLRGNCDCCLYFIRRSFVSHVQIQVTRKQEIRSLQSTTLPTTQWHKQSKSLRLHERIRRTAMFQGSRTAVPIRRKVHVHSKHTAQCKKSFQHLFLVRERNRPQSHNRERAKRAQCSLRSHRIFNKERAFQTM